MTAQEQLHALWRQFPRSEELAVSRALAEQFEAECVRVLRFSNAPGSSPHQWFPVEQYRGLTAQRLPLVYRNRRLVLVETAA